jgi:hypothetical protein
MLNDEITLEISKFDKDIDEHREALEKESVWLFLATLGCYGVTNNDFLQTIAFLITFAFFISRVNSRKNKSNTKLFILREKEIKKMITSKLNPGDIQQEQLNNLKKIRNEKLTLFQHIRSNPMYIICFIFLLASMEDLLQPNLISLLLAR